MAEAIVNSHLSETWEAVSAGTKPAGYVHPKAIQVLSEIGIHHQGRSKLADEFRPGEDHRVVGKPPITRQIDISLSKYLIYPFHFTHIWR